MVLTGMAASTWLSGRTEGQAEPSQRWASASGGAPTASRMGTSGHDVAAGVATPEILCILKSSPNRDGVHPGLVDMCAAPERALGGVGVLEVDRELVPRRERLSGAPMTAGPETFDDTNRVAWQRHTIVLVCLPEDPGFICPGEVDGEVEMTGCEVRKTMCRHLV